MLGEHPIGAMIPATDLARARTFYVDTLGFKPITENPEGIDLEAPFPLPVNIRQIETLRGQAIIVQ